MATLLLKQMELKFGAVDDAARQRINEASSKQIERWAGKILTATSLEEMFKKRLHPQKTLGNQPE